jgi:hypothetical protein
MFFNFIIALYNYRCPMDDMEIAGASVRTLLEKCNAAVLKATGKKIQLWQTD